MEKWTSQLKSCVVFKPHFDDRVFVLKVCGNDFMSLWTDPSQNWQKVGFQYAFNQVQRKQTSAQTQHLNLTTKILTPAAIKGQEMLCSTENKQKVNN